MWTTRYGTHSTVQNSLSYWYVGIVYCTCGHFLRNGTEENKKFVQYTLDLFSIPNYYIKKGRHHGHRYGKTPGDHEYSVANSLKKNARSSTSVSTTVSSETRSSGRTCLTSSWDGQIGGRRPNAPHYSRKNLCVIRCQSGIDLTSSKHCLPCDSSNTKKIQLISKDGKVIPHLGGTGKNPGGILLMSITTKTDPALIDQGNDLKSDWDTFLCMILKINVLHHYSSKFGNSQQQFTITDGSRCKHNTSNTAKSYVKWIRWKQLLR